MTIPKDPARVAALLAKHFPDYVPAQPTTPRAVECAKEIEAAYLDGGFWITPKDLAPIISQHYPDPTPDEVARPEPQPAADALELAEFLTWKPLNPLLDNFKIYHRDRVFLAEEVMRLRAEVTRLTAALAEAGKALPTLIWAVLWAERETERTGLHGMFVHEQEARKTVESLNGANKAVYRAEQWSLIGSARPNQSAT